MNKIAEYVRTCKLKYIERVNIDELFQECNSLA